MKKRHFIVLFFFLTFLQFLTAQVPPFAQVDYDTAEVNTTLNVAAPGVLVNDSDADPDDILTVSAFNVNGISYVASQLAVLAEGSITINTDGSYTFIPFLNYTGNVPTIIYTVSDGTFTTTANLLLTVEHIDNLLDISPFSSCNQGFTANGEYKLRYTVVLKNKSTARDYHPSSLIKNIDLTSNLQSTFGNGCVVGVDGVEIYNNNFTPDYINDTGYPREFTGAATNSNFLNVTSNSIFNADAIANLTLYPRQNIVVVFCVTVNPFCNGRPNPTPSGAGIDFDSTINVTSDRGNDSDGFTLTDFHTTEAVIAAGLHVPKFNDLLDPPGTINSDGTYDYINTVIITNEGTSTANNVNYNMGLGSFLDNGITFQELKVNQVSGPNVLVNTAFNGDTSSTLLMPNTSLAPGQTIILEVFYLIEPYSSTNYSYFYQNDKSQTQGGLDGFDETTTSNKRLNSFVVWSDNLGNHLDRYYKSNSPTEIVSSSLQCDCTRASMRFLFTSSSSTNKIISEVKKAPNTILEQEEVTFQITIKNTSESVQLENLQLKDDLTNICGGNIISVTKPFIQKSSATTNPILNVDFDGSSDSSFFDGTSGLLKVNETITIQFSVVYSESCIGINTAFFTSTVPLGDPTESFGSVIVNASTDTDNDGIINSIDIDDDNDTILDTLEYNGLNPLDDDDADFIPNYRDTDFGADANGDGIVDIFDFDSDGVPNHFDLDSDNDGILDIVEAGNAIKDTNNNGATNNAVGANGLDNALENNDSPNASINYTIPNTDANGNPNYLDIDADGDGIVDNIEAQLTENYKPLSGTVSSTGIDTAYPNGINPTDTDNDTIFDYIDLNSDNDIRDDRIEGWDTNSDGIAETIAFNLDADNDGLDDAFDRNRNLVNPTNGQVPTDFPNIDNIDNPERDWREILAIIVVIDNVIATEGEDFVFTLKLVTKNDNSILIESASPIDINLSTINGTDTTNVYDVATSPFDYSGFTNTTFTIPPFTNTIQFTVNSLEDIIYELDELFTLNGAITSNNTINNSIRGIGTILDNDAKPSVTMNNSREEEGIDLEHTIKISNPSSTPIIIEINTSDNLAISPDDYTSILESLTINGTVNPNNANTQISFSIATKTDNLNELEEENLNVIGVVTTNNIGAQDLNKTGVILDIDPNPLVDIQDITVVEGGVLVFTIRLLNADLQPMQNYRPINFILETLDDTANANEDYKPIAIFTNIPAFTSSIIQAVETLEDALNEDTETLILQATTNLSNVSNTFIPAGIGFIKDNDYPNLFSPNSDGKSDLFKISGIEEYANFKLNIVDRWGNEVYNYTNNGRVNPIWWDGTRNGNPVPAGVYFYTLDFNDGTTKPIRNFIELIR
ncbi:T9SS type B sorting domain-containing protein [Polaribacter glomeratus]|uniref:DUF11 domain-containing protein n=1 Tax=Polaribacter glomeratus TaxID=102 RepID=A0A2S7WV93_9FLAO|nr:gliding motility-associated C-terminal domain-containing protein [Polaribacter glomeratus]PQJ81515.1 hypothetical protein BTO16_02535 [Polaribacter glomeratus]TXD64655.1 T9SS type B sorting domain-containing protein [Polaribacter glomeratus]